MKGLRISVLMPVFNCEQYLQPAIESILNQSLSDLELIVVDDCSTDDSLRIARSFKDSRVRIATNQTHLGISGSRNRAIAESRGQYIAWLDSDDIAMPRRLQRQAEVLDADSKAGFCHSNFAVIDRNGSVITAQWHSDGMLPTEWLMLWTNPIAQSTVMIRKTILGTDRAPYNSECDPAEDYDLWTRLMLKTRIVFIDQVLVRYRSVETSAFHRSPQRALLQSIKSNDRLLRAIAGVVPPSFHRHLTSFSGALETEMEPTQIG